MKKVLLLSVAFSLVIFNAQAQQDFGLVSEGTNFLNTAKRLYPIIVALVFLISVFFNIGLLMGDNRDYKAFFTKIILYVGGVVLSIGVFHYLATKSL